MTNRQALLPNADHYISLEEAIKMTTLYRNEKEKILQSAYQSKGLLPICETFDRVAFDTLLKQPGCVGIRLYVGMDEALKLRLIAVGVNDKNEDILPASAGSFAATDDGDDGTIVEEGQRCPDICPPTSPLNGG